MGEPLFSIQDLKVSFPGAPEPVLNGVNLEMDSGQALALVGPSGCGKSLTALALCGLLPPNASWSGGIYWRGEKLTDPRSARWQAVRGPGAALVLQEPATSLNPVLRIGDQIAESVRRHAGGSAQEARARAVELLAEVKVSNPVERARTYPHQLSGGMRQRVLLAATLACDPSLLIADEPTTALDLTVQREILVLLDTVCRRRGMGLLFISHDLDVVSLLASKVAVMRDGKIETVRGTNLPAVVPNPERVIPALSKIGAPVLTARGLVVGYDKSGREGLFGDQPVAGVDLDLVAGQALGLAGESGCGKTTLGRALARQVDPMAGSLALDRQDLLELTGRNLRQARRQIQMIFQDPGASLNPRQKIGAALREAQGPSHDSGTTVSLLEEVGLDPALAHRYPHELSGGQRQRVAVARCLAADPAVLIADEVTSALDGASCDRLLELFSKLMVQRKLALLVISHDLQVLQRICQRIMVMKSGLILEVYPTSHGQGGVHPYTQDLVAASPVLLRQRPTGLAGLQLASGSLPANRVSGCPWHTCCKIAKPHCASQLPPLVQVAPGHHLRCPETHPFCSSHFIDT